MKKIIPIVALLGIGLLTTGCANDKGKTLSINENIKDFTASVNNYTKLNDTTTNNVLKKYRLAVSDNKTIDGVLNNDNTPHNGDNKIDNRKPYVDRLTKDYIDPELDKLYENQSGISTLEYLEKDTITNNPSQRPLESNSSDDNNISLNETENNVENIINKDENNSQNENMVENNPINDNISTLYSLTEDIEKYTDDYLNLKQSITSAISETENLLNKVKNGEVQLSAEQRMMLTTQSMQLKDLSKQLSLSTTKLNLELSDLNDMLRNNKSLDDLVLKYLVVLDNIANGNEMLENGLYSLNLINQMFYANGHLAAPYGRLMYGFKRKGEPAQFKQYEIQDGKIVENSNNQNENNDKTDEEAGIEPHNKKLQSNIDSYNTNYHNIDSFFNTALLDNQFMYGGNGYGYGMNGFYGTYAPYVNNNMNMANNTNATNQNVTNQNIETNNTTNSADNMDNTQNTKKSKKRFSKNIDTYKTDSTPTLSARFKNLKMSFKKPKIKNPVYRYNDDTVSEQNSTEQDNDVNIKNALE